MPSLARRDGPLEAAIQHVILAVQDAAIVIPIDTPVLHQKEVVDVLLLADLFEVHDLCARLRAFLHPRGLVAGSSEVDREWNRIQVVLIHQLLCWHHHLILTLNMLAQEWELRRLHELIIGEDRGVVARELAGADR